MNALCRGDAGAEKAGKWKN